MVNKKTIRDVNVKDKRVLVRVDFNVPLNSGSNQISDDTRIRASIPTIEYLLKQRARILLCAHLGRPGGKVVEELRLAPVAKRLSQLIDAPVNYSPTATFAEALAKANDVPDGHLLLMENLRFYPEEEKNKAEFSKSLASLADVYVNDAFSVSQRSHASLVGVPSYLPAVAGFLMEKEVATLEKVLNNPLRPMAALIGGAKISDKVAVMKQLLDTVDTVLVGGGMVATFLKAQGLEVGRSTIEENMVEFAHGIVREAKGKGIRFCLPSDVVVAQEFRADAWLKISLTDKVPSEGYIMDIGPETIRSFQEEIRRSRTIIWNGPMGVFEFPAFSQGTRTVAETMADLRGAITVVGGGSTSEAVRTLGLADKMTHVSMGGGATLEFLEGKVLPGIAALMDKNGA